MAAAVARNYFAQTTTLSGCIERDSTTTVFDLERRRYLHNTCTQPYIVLVRHIVCLHNNNIYYIIVENVTARGFYAETRIIKYNARFADRRTETAREANALSALFDRIINAVGYNII